MSLSRYLGQSLILGSTSRTDGPAAEDHLKVQDGGAKWLPQLMFLSRCCTAVHGVDSTRTGRGGNVRQPRGADECRRDLLYQVP